MSPELIDARREFQAAHRALMDMEKLYREAVNRRSRALRKWADLSAGLSLEEINAIVNAVESEVLP